MNVLYNYMAMISISHTKKAIPLSYYTHMVVSWLCGQMKPVGENKSLEYKMCLGELYVQVELYTTYSAI